MKVPLDSIYQGNIPYEPPAKRQHREEVKLTDLFKETITNICAHAEPAAMCALIGACKEFSEKKHEIYRAILAEAGLIPHYLESGLSSLPKFLHATTQQIHKNLTKLEEHFSDEDFDWEFLINLTSPIIEQLKGQLNPEKTVQEKLRTILLAKNWLKAFPSVLLWNKLNCLSTVKLEDPSYDTFHGIMPEEMEDSIGLKQLATPEKWIEKAAEFKDWLKEHEKEVKELTSLDLNWYPLTQIPLEIYEFTQLEFLDMIYTPLIDISPRISELTNLQRLDLYSCQLESLPTSIGQLTNLQELSLANNHLTQLPTEMGNLTTLKRLMMENNQLDSPPSFISQLTNLIELSYETNNDTFLERS